MNNGLLKTLNTQLQTVLNEAMTLRAAMEKSFADASGKDYEGLADDRAKLTSLADRGAELKSQIEAIKQIDVQIEFSQLPEEKKETIPSQSLIPQRKTAGQLVIESDQFKEAASTGELKRVEVKDLLESSGATGGYLVQADRRGPYMLPVLPTSVLDVITVVPTTSNLVEVVTETPSTNTAAFVPEGEVKPKNDMTFALANVPILTLAKYICASRQILQDAPRLRTYIDLHLRSRLREKLNNSIINGIGGATDLSGLLVAAGTQQRTQAVASNGMGAVGDSVIDTIRYGIADLELAGFQADVIVLHPSVAATIETAKTSQGVYLFIFAPTIDVGNFRLWRVRVITDAKMPVNRVIVMDTSMSAELYLRNNIEIFTGQPDDYFLRNLFAILGELRAGLGYPYPKGIVEITLA